jgi:fatty acid desaturase
MIMRDEKKIRNAVGSEKIKNLMAKNDFLACAYFFSRLLGLVVPLLVGYVAWDNGNFVVSLILLSIYGIQMRFMGWAGFGHELFHRSVFSSVRLNTLLFRLFSSLNLANYGFFEIFHPIHHRATLKTGGDFEGYAAHNTFSPITMFFQCTINMPRFFRDLRILFDNSRGVIALGERYTLEISESQRRIIVNGARGSVLSIFSFTVLAMFVTDFIFGLLITISPYIFTLLNDHLANQQHKNGLWDQESILANTNTVVPNAIVRWLYASMNFHVEHHMFPGVPFYNLHEAHKLFAPHYPSIKKN